VDDVDSQAEDPVEEAGIRTSGQEKSVPQPLRASLSPWDSWLLPGFGNMTHYFRARQGEQKRKRGAEKVGMEPPELVIGAQFLLYERGYSDGLNCAP